MKEKDMLNGMKAIYNYLTTKDKKDYGQEEYETLIEILECAKSLYTYLSCFLTTVYVEKYLPKEGEFDF